MRIFIVKILGPIFTKWNVDVVAVGLIAQNRSANQT